MPTWLVPIASALLLAGCGLSLGCAAPARPTPSELAALRATYQDQASQEQTTTTVEVSDDDDGDRGVGHRLLWYIPNRISDILDIVRLRLRVGPGFSIGARVTELVDVNVGGYTSIFVGLPGPRRERAFNWPFGIENMTGAELSVFDGTTFTGTGDGPHYGAVEVGAGTQLLLIGIDIGVDVWEVVDFVTGLITIDVVPDDI